MRQSTILSYNVMDMFELFAYSYYLRAKNIRQVDSFLIYFDTEEARGYFFRVRVSGDSIDFEINDPTKNERELAEEMKSNRIETKMTSRDGKMMDYIRKRRFLSYHGKT